MQRNQLVEEEKEFNIFDPDSGDADRLNQLVSGQQQQPVIGNAANRPQAQGEVMPGAYMSNDDCFDLFIDFIESDEWLLPIESFIEYFCLIFVTEDYEENRAQKYKVFEEYQKIVKMNLEKFLHEILNYGYEQLWDLLALYEKDLQPQDLIYITAVEDYREFHDFMYDENIKLNQSNKRRFQEQITVQGGVRGTMGATFANGFKSDQISEEELIQQAIRQSLQNEGKQTQKPTDQGFTEEEMLAMAIAESEAAENARKQLQQSQAERNDEMLMQAIAASKAHEDQIKREEQARMMEALRISESTGQQEELKRRMQREAEQERERQRLQAIEEEAKLQAQRAAEEERKQANAAQSKKNDQRDKLRQKLKQEFHDQEEERRENFTKENMQNVDINQSLAASALLKNLDNQVNRDKLIEDAKKRADMRSSREFHNLAQAKAKISDQALPPVKEQSASIEATIEPKKQAASTMESIPVNDQRPVEQQLESLEERTLRLKARRDQLLKKKAEEEAKKNAQQEEKKRDEGDVFRNTRMKFNEKPEEKKMRLKRCLNALQKQDLGKPSAFIKMEVGQPIQIDWNSKEKSAFMEDADDEDGAVEFVKVGKKVLSSGF